MDLQKLFYPETIALIGASDKVGTVGHALVTNLSTFKTVFYVNPYIPRINNQSCYAKIADISKDIDLAIIAVPAKIVPLLVEEVAQKGTKNIIILSSGFREIGRTDLEDLVKLICQKNNINLLGPNCLGLVNPKISLNATFSNTMPLLGPVGFVSQSGALCASIIEYSPKLNIGYSQFVSLGNKTIINENQILEYFETDPSTKIIAVYTEQLISPSQLFHLTKPVIVLKSGTTSAGQAAAKSHTGAISGTDSAYEALFAQTGAIRANSISDFINFQSIFCTNELPRGNRLSIITNAGGVGVIAADAAIKNNLIVDHVTDLLGDATPEKYSLALVQNNSDSILVILTPQSVTQVAETAQVIIDFHKNSHVPLVVCFLGGDSVDQSIKLLRQHHICVIDYPEAAVAAIGALTSYSLFYKQPPKINFEKFDIVPSKNLLESYGLPAISSYLASTVDAASEYVKNKTGKFVLKISSPDILHKSDVGGVILDVDSANLSLEYQKLLDHIGALRPDAKIDGILIEPMLDRTNSLELIIGATTDPSLGHIIMVGYGGIYTEVLADVAFGVVPLTRTDAYNLISQLKVKKILDGVRGRPHLDIESVVDCLGRLSQLLVDHPEISELDINPLLVSEHGSQILDYRILK
ncbi:MAG: acetate--CoA ligase family protein [Microgenomates group bacterium]